MVTFLENFENMESFKIFLQQSEQMDSCGCSIGILLRRIDRNRKNSTTRRISNQVTRLITHINGTLCMKGTDTTSDSTNKDEFKSNFNSNTLTYKK